MEKLLIVDGMNLLFQMYYGMPERILGNRGQAIHGTLGFVGALLKILRMVKPTHVAVLFDGECENHRKTLDADYKANRPDWSELEETPFTQLPDVYAALDHLGICHRETECCEADDWIAGYAKTYAETMDVVICSQDSDFFQLIGDRVTVLRYRGKQSVLCDRAYIREKLGIEPEQYAAFKSMTGDGADNIKGAEKVGPKTAAWLLSRFGNLEAIIENAESIEKPSIRASIQRNGPRLRLNDLLIRLEGTQALPFPLEALAFTDPGLTTTQVLQNIDLR